jgi:hypothetical protein
MIAAMQDRVQDAVSAFERAAEYDPGNPETHYSLGEGYAQLGRTEDAKRSFERVLELEPGAEEARAKLEALDGRAPARGPVAGTGDHWSKRLTPEERAAGDQLARLRKKRNEALEGLCVVVLGCVYGLWLVWDERRKVAPGRPMAQAVGEDEWFMVGAFALAVAALSIAFLITIWRLRRYASRLEAEEMRSQDIITYAEEVFAQAEYEELRADGEEDKRRDLEWAEESRRAKVWWRREFSGAHLVWWIAFAVFGGQELKVLVIPGAMADAVIVCAILGAILKVLMTAVMLPFTYRMAVRYYRWWGRGWLPVVLALLPAVAGYFAGNGGG